LPLVEGRVGLGRGEDPHWEESGDEMILELPPPLPTPRTRPIPRAPSYPPPPRERAIPAKAPPAVRPRPPAPPSHPHRDTSLGRTSSSSRGSGGDRRPAPY
jgi:hypothetical protein